jgi:hypothetical protein
METFVSEGCGGVEVLDLKDGAKPIVSEGCGGVEVLDLKDGAKPIESNGEIAGRGHSDTKSNPVDDIIKGLGRTAPHLFKRAIKRLDSRQDGWFEISKLFNDERLQAAGEILPYR